MKPAFHRLGLIGHPLGHSRSPALHHAALHSAGLAGEYLLYPVAPLPEGQASLAELAARLRSGELHGLNVTIPHKQNVLPLLDEQTPVVRAIGAANTLFMQGDQLWGANTDAPAFLAEIQNLQGQAHADGQTALVLGAGGSARTAVYTLAQAGWQVWVASRRPEQGTALVAALLERWQPGPKPTLAACPFDAGHLAGLHFDLLVNTTPVGMFPHVEENPWPLDAFPTGARVYDMIYNPLETRLLQAARQAGLPVANGLGMLVEQAALAFERWTGQPANRQEMHMAVLP